MAILEIEQKRCSKKKMKERLEIGNKELKKWFGNKQKYIEFAMKAIANTVKAGYLNRARLPGGGAPTHCIHIWMTI